jgi:ABC-type phosphate transport system substrate-binding protein
VNSIPGSIGYVECQYAVMSNLSQAAVLNSAGKFVNASTDSIVAACDAVEEPRWNSSSASLATFRRKKINKSREFRRFSAFDISCSC